MSTIFTEKDIKVIEQWLNNGGNVAAFKTNKAAACRTVKGLSRDFPVHALRYQIGKRLKQKSLIVRRSTPVPSSIPTRWSPRRAPPSPLLVSSSLPTPSSSLSAPSSSLPILSSALPTSSSSLPVSLLSLPAPSSSSPASLPPPPTPSSSPPVSSFTKKHPKDRWRGFNMACDLWEEDRRRWYSQQSEVIHYLQYMQETALRR